MTYPLYAVVPVKETVQAKQRLAGLLSPSLRQQLALAMLQDVLDTLSAVSALAGIMVVTEDAEVTQIARNYRARLSTAGASDGHTGAVTAAARVLAAEGFGMMAIPADIPLVTPADIAQVLASHQDGRAFTIVPARDLQGSNTIVCTPADAVPLRFGTDSYFPHLAAAKAHGIVPREVVVPNIALDIDTPDDLTAFLTTKSDTRAHRLVTQSRTAIGRTTKAPDL
jgi:2-phospho-L-lactate guanylyltransferase